MNSIFGDEVTRYFYELTPEKILAAAETFGLRCTGRVLPLNSFENRVYEIELEFEAEKIPVHRHERFCVAKFYRPGRWSQEQILEEHQFLADLKAAEIPAVAPIKIDGESLHKVPEVPIWCAVFPKVGGRNPDELSDDALEQIGRLLGRMHTVGAEKEAKHRVHLTPQTYGIENLRFLSDNRWLPSEIASDYQKTVEEICTICTPWFDAAPTQRLHGDAHLGNLLHNQEGYFWVDFDDMVVGPCVQDLWLLMPGRESEVKQKWEVLLEGYEQMRVFPRQSLRLVEALRALRYIHYAAWIARRWQDPAFPKTFVQFGTPRYWQEQLQDLQQQLTLLKNPI